MAAPMLPALSPAWPEMVLAGAAMVLLVFGAIRGEVARRTIAWLGVAVLIGLLVAIEVTGGGSNLGFYGMFIDDAFARFVQGLVLLGAAVAILMGLQYNESEGIAHFEMPVLIMLATTGMMVMISANNLIVLYVGLELQNLGLYVIASFNRDSVRSTEAGLKYFVLGALSSGMLLYGASLIYGFTGSVGFPELAHHLAGGVHASPGLLIGIIFVVVGLAFKVSAVPFHMWTPDVYEGAPTPVSAFFSISPKFAALALLIRFLVEPFGALLAEWQQVVILLSIASMVFGAVAAIAQQNIKRMMAYSSIGHVGYALIGLACGTANGIRGVLVYLVIYLVMNLGAWAVIVCMRRRGRMVEGISDLAGLSHTQPALALALAIFMFSLTGIPPTAGFFAKLYIFFAAIDTKLTGLAIIGVVTSVVGAFYYLRVVKVMYFDEPAAAALDRSLAPEMKGILVVTGIVTLFFFALPGPIIGAATAAAAALFAQ